MNHSVGALFILAISVNIHYWPLSETEHWQQFLILLVWLLALFCFILVCFLFFFFIFIFLLLFDQMYIVFLKVYEIQTRRENTVLLSLQRMQSRPELRYVLWVKKLVSVFLLKRRWLLQLCCTSGCVVPRQVSHHFMSCYQKFHCLYAT